MISDLFIIANLQNDFYHPDGRMYTPENGKILEKIVVFLKEKITSFSTVWLIKLENDGLRCNQTENDEEIKLSESFYSGTFGSEICADIIEVLPKVDKVFTHGVTQKNRESINLINEINRMVATKVYVVGSFQNSVGNIYNYVSRQIEMRYPEIEEVELVNFSSKLFLDQYDLDIVNISSSIYKFYFNRFPNLDGKVIVHLDGRFESLLLLIVLTVVTGLDRNKVLGVTFTQDAKDFLEILPLRESWLLDDIEIKHIPIDESVCRNAANLTYCKHMDSPSIIEAVLTSLVTSKKGTLMSATSATDMYLRRLNPNFRNVEYSPFLEYTKQELSNIACSFFDPCIISRYFRMNDKEREADKVLMAYKKFQKCNPEKTINFLKWAQFTLDPKDFEKLTNK